MSTFIDELNNIELPDEDTLNKMLSRTKGQVFMGGPDKGAGFIGSLMCDHKFVWDDDCNTAWCNGTMIGWNPRFFVWLSPAERITVLVHEVWHTGFEHMGRLYERCPDIWNQAADFVINNMLKKQGYVFGTKLMSLEPCLDPQYDGMSTEEVYDLLPKNPGKPMPQQCNNPGPADPNGSVPAPGQDKAQNKGTDAPGGAEQTSSNPLQGDVRPASTEPGAQGERIGRLVKAKQASQMAKEAGIVPGETELIIEEFLNPILPWEVLLQRFFTEFSQDDYSFKRPSRRYEDDYLPSLLGDNGLEHLNYYWDISGSISDATILRCHSELKYIHDMLQPKRLTIITFDTMIQDVYDFTDDMPYDKITVHGRGGTSLEPVREHIKKTQPTAAVIFSDLHVRPMTQDPGVPILWVVIGNKKAKTHFGQVIHIPDETIYDYSLPPIVEG